MDVVIYAPKNRLFVETIDAVGKALSESACRVTWIKELGILEGCAPDLVILTSEHSVVLAKRTYPSARIFQICASVCGAVTSLYKRVSGAAPDWQVSLLPRANQVGRNGIDASHRLISTRREKESFAQAPAWMHAMPKDIPTALIFSSLTENLSDAAFNFISFAGTLAMPETSNTYSKPLSALSAALSFAQLAVVEDDEALALRMARNGVPVVFATHAPETEFVRAFGALNLGIVVDKQKTREAMHQILSCSVHSGHTKAYAHCVDSAPTPKEWVDRLLTQMRNSAPVLNVQPIFQPEAG